MGGRAFDHKNRAGALLGGVTLSIFLPLSVARAACDLVDIPPLTVSCTGSSNDAFPRFFPFFPFVTTEVKVGGPGNAPAQITTSPPSILFPNAIDLTVHTLGPFGIYGAVDTVNVGTPSTIIGTNDGIRIEGENGASVRIGQTSEGGNGLNANVTGQTGHGIEALTDTNGQILITTAPGTTVLGAAEGIRTSAVDGATFITLNGNVTTNTPASFFDVHAISSGSGSHHDRGIRKCNLWRDQG